MNCDIRVITDLEQVTATWLTDILTKSDAMTSGAVTGFKAKRGTGSWSQNARFTLDYSTSARGECPASLFVKLVNTVTRHGEFFLPSEITYYQRDYTDLSNAPLVRCYDAAHDAEQNRYHLVLEDLSLTHDVTYHLLPALEHGLALAGALAAMHAHWWGVKRLQKIGATAHDARHVRRFVEIGRPGITHVHATFGDRLEPHWAELMEQIFSRFPVQVTEESQNQARFTLIHGDLNPGNILVPKKGVQPLYFLDQQPFNWSLTTWFGAYDLVYVMALYWESEQRRALERPILRHYHKMLQARGVQNYSWAQLLDDYRLCVALTVPIAVEYMRDGVDPKWQEFLFRLLTRSLTACDDWECQKLL